LKIKPLTFTLQPENNAKLANLCGEHDKNLRQIEDYFNVEINNRGNEFYILGNKNAAQNAKQAIKLLFDEAIIEKYITPGEINLVMQSITTNRQFKQKRETQKIINTPKTTVKPRTSHQIRYLEEIDKYPLIFSIGPAGTGKTYLAVAYAVNALETQQVNRIIITRPVVEAGERLGYLPGDIAQKVDPYLRPIYDALYEMLGFREVAKLVENHAIEIAPLAFMRGRTLNDAIIILDEAQNTTIEQMKMFLTRIGFGSKAIITGDITQIDLPKSQPPGLKNALEILKDEPDIGFCFFDASDVVRHPIVQRIVRAYESASSKQ
jgi:phosphate starvation-inducible PhoH-like protein